MELVPSSQKPSTLDMHHHPDSDSDETDRMIAALKRGIDRWKSATKEMIVSAIDQGAEQIEVYSPLHQKLGGMTSNVYIVCNGERIAYSTFLSRYFYTATLPSEAHLEIDLAREEVDELPTIGNLTFQHNQQQYHFEVAVGPRLDDWVILRLQQRDSVAPEHVFESLMSPPPDMYSKLNHPSVHRARELARADFGNISRKVPEGSNYGADWYYGHLHTVATILSEYEFSAEVIAAGYLHDHLEDLPEKYERRTLERLFNPRIAELVNWVTQQDKSLSWEARNEAYNERLRSAPSEALAISAADKLSNIQDIIPFLKLGYPVNSILKRGWKQNSEKFHSLLELFEGEIPKGLFDRLSNAIELFDRYGSKLTRKERRFK
jgi:hypothetical protein